MGEVEPVCGLLGERKQSQGEGAAGAVVWARRCCRGGGSLVASGGGEGAALGGRGEAVGWRFRTA